MDRPSGLRLSAVLAELDDPAGPDGEPPPLTLGEITDRTAFAGFGFLNLFLALVSIPFFGLSAPFGLAIAVLGAQMLVGRDRPWLPGFLRRRRAPARSIRWLSGRVARWTAGLERWIKPRLGVLTRGPLIGLSLIVQGLGLALPIPIPGSNWIFVVPIIVYALGLLERDGALVLVGHAATAVQIVLGITFAHVVRAALERIFA
jgi:hypothetical protein